MPRVGRIHQRALCYHMMNRGVNRGPLFSDDTDRQYFSDLVTEYKATKETLMSGVDEKVVRQMENEQAFGSKELAATLKMDRGRYRVKRGRPRNTAAITS